VPSAEVTTKKSPFLSLTFVAEINIFLVASILFKNNTCLGQFFQI
jgi:hypothetical protein